MDFLVVLAVFLALVVGFFVGIGIAERVKIEKLIDFFLDRIEGQRPHRYPEIPNEDLVKEWFYGKSEE